MSDQLPSIPAGSTIRQNADRSWQYRSKAGPWCDMPAPLRAAPWATPSATPSAASVPMERLDAQSLAIQLEHDGKYLMASAMAHECPRTRDMAVRVIRAAVLLAGGWGGEL
jgi:hypothetical protein